MRFLIGFIAFFAINSQFTLLFNQHTLANAASSEHSQEHSIDTFPSDGYFNTDRYVRDAVENSDVESVPIDVSGNVSIGNGNHAGKLYNWDDYMGSIDMYAESGDYDYGN